MAEPDSPDSLPTQPWSGLTSRAPEATPDPAPTPANPTPRRGGMGDAPGRQLAVFFDRQPLIRWPDATLTGTEAAVGSSKSVEFKDAERVALPTPTP